MMLRSIELIHAAIPLKSKVRHASHERTSSDSLIVKATLESGVVGYGEGVPRSYVTGETIETAFDALRSFDAARAIGSPSDFDQAVTQIAALKLPSIENDPRGMFGNAARAALELALFDAYCRHFDRSVGEAVRRLAEAGLRYHGRPWQVRYSGAITADSPRKERMSAFKMRIYGFHQVKIKVGVEGQDDPARLSILRKILGGGMDIRIDANEAWTASTLLQRVTPLRRFRPTALEQPIPHSEVADLADLRPEIGIPVMLDESLCGYPDAVRSIAQNTADMFNVRISKCGGLVPSLRIMALAGRNRLDVQLGCHPGETGLLSAAGRHLAANIAGIRYVEGSYDRHVLGTNILVEDITFKYGGRAQPLNGPGLGVTVNPRVLDSITVKRHEVDFG